MRVCERREGGRCNGLQIYDFKFIAVVFEGGLFLLKQAVGEELGGVRDNESGAEVELAEAMVNSDLFIEIYRCLSP